MIIAMLAFLLSSPDTDRMVQAIEAVENSPWTSPGGAFQFKRETWFEETGLPYEKARNRELARRVASVVIAKHANRLKAVGVTPTPYLLGSIWNKGWTGAMKLHREKKPDDYGERVHNYFHAHTR